MVFVLHIYLLCHHHLQGLQELGQQVKTLPSANYNLLKYICKYVHSTGFKNYNTEPVLLQSSKILIVSEL